MRVHVQHLSGVTIPEDVPLRRRSPVPEAERDEAFRRIFDDRTLIYDCTYLEHAKGHLITAPSLDGLWPHLRDGLTIGGQRRRVRRRRFGRCDQVFVGGAPGPVELFLNGRRIPVPVRSSIASAFEGLNAAVTMNLDNDLRHVRDWVRYHVRTQRLEAAVIFDNGSTRYSATDLAEDLSDGTGLKAAAVLVAPFPYGGRIRTRRGMLRLGFLQPAMLNLARAEVLSRARAVLGCDIDELVTGPHGASVFDAAASSSRGFVKLGGEWIFPAPEQPAPQPHAAHVWRADPPKRCKTKWVSRPDAWLPRLVGWKVHDLGRNASDPIRPDRRFSLHHCAATTTGWKPGSPRWTTTGLRSDPGLSDLFQRDLPDESQEPGGKARRSGGVSNREEIR